MKSIEEILATDDAHRETIEVPEWGTAITVVSMTALERADIERAWSKKEASSDPAKFRCDVLSRSIKNGDNKPWGTPEQFASLMGKNAEVIERLFESACRLSGFSGRDVKELEKN